MVTGSWIKTGASRIVPWYFGLMRAEFEWRRDITDPDGMSGDMIEIKWSSAGRLPAEYDNPGPFGFLSVVAAPPGDSRYGEYGAWRRFISYWQGDNMKRNFGLYQDGKVVSDFETVRIAPMPVEHEPDAIEWLEPVPLWRRMLKMIGVGYGRR